VAIVSLASRGALRVAACEGLPASAAGTQLPFDREVLAADGPLVLSDLAADARFRDHPWVTGPLRLRFYAGTVIAHEGRPAGVLAVADREPGSLAEGDLIMLRDVARLAESEVKLALQARAREARDDEAMQTSRPIVFDPRTRLWNRHAMFELIDREFYRSRRERDAVAAIVAEIDGFEALQPGLGREDADALVAEVARRLRDVVRRSDIVGRAQGNQFLIFLSRCNLDNAMKLAERMRHGARKLPVQLRGQSVPVTIALGVAASEAGAEWMPDQLIKAAEQAVGEARSAGGDTVASRALS
jgi:diguanylate cyclase (GGDEF)-like protein